MSGDTFASRSDRKCFFECGSSVKQEEEEEEKCFCNVRKWRQKKRKRSEEAVQLDDIECTVRASLLSGQT
jgi:hypothetical protein